MEESLQVGQLYYENSRCINDVLRALRTAYGELHLSVLFATPSPIVRSSNHYWMNSTE